MQIRKFNLYKSDKENEVISLIKEDTYYYSLSELNSPSKLTDFLNVALSLNKRAEEYVYLMAVDAKMKIKGLFEISHGTVDASLLNPREIFERALLCGAHNIVLAHNHPSGNTSPSREDINATKRIQEAGKLLGIELRDHLIVGDNYYSFRESGLM